MSTVWIINQYASTPDTGAGGRHYYLARELARLGHQVTLVGASWHHLLKGDADTSLETEERDGIRFVRVPVPRYAHAHDKRRVLNWLLFSHRLRHLRARFNETPDAIMYSSPSLIGFSGAERLARKTGARLIFEVRDIWPLTLQEVGGQSPRHPLMRWMQWVEDRAYRISNAVISNLPNAVDHMVTRGMDRGKFTWVPNGLSQEEVSNPERLEPDIADGLPHGKFIVGYTGTLGAANALETMVEAAEKLREHTDIAFVIVGNGRERDRLDADVARRGLKNIHLLDAVPKRQVQSMLARFDACVICWRNMPLYRFGTAANKIPEYLYSARPVLNCFTGYGDLIRKYQAGICVEAEDPIALAEAVLSLKALPQADRVEMGGRGHAAALEHHEYGALAKKLEKVLFP